MEGIISFSKKYLNEYDTIIGVHIEHFSMLWDKITPSNNAIIIYSCTRNYWQSQFHGFLFVYSINHTANNGITYVNVLINKRNNFYILSDLDVNFSTISSLKVSSHLIKNINKIIDLDVDYIAKLSVALEQFSITETFVCDYKNNSLSFFPHFYHDHQFDNTYNIVGGLYPEMIYNVTGLFEEDPISRYDLYGKTKFGFDYKIIDCELGGYHYKYRIKEEFYNKCPACSVIMDNIIVDGFHPLYIQSVIRCEKTNAIVYCGIINNGENMRDILANCIVSTNSIVDAEKLFIDFMEPRSIIKNAIINFII